MNQYDIDALSEIALELFVELASDNLPEHEIARFNQDFNTVGLLAEFDVADDWADDVNFAINDSDYAELWIGLGDNQGEFSHVFARMLLSRDKDEKFCHIEWLPALAH